MAKMKRHGNLFLDKWLLNTTMSITSPNSYHPNLFTRNAEFISNYEGLNALF